MIRVALVDDQEMIRMGLKGILKTRPGFTVVGEAADGLEAVGLITAMRPDVVLMDIRMPGIDGVEAVRRIRTVPDLNDVRILILTTFENDVNVIRAIQAGAEGFLGKNVGPSELVAAIERVATGGALLSPAAVNSVVAHVAEAARPAIDMASEAALASLTARERDVVIQVAAGLSNEQIASQMFISPHTVKTHLNRAMAKSGSKDRAQLVILAFKAGIANPT